MKIFALLTVLVLLLVAGCTSGQGNGYATYSGGGNSPPPSGGGGCGRFASVGSDSCPSPANDAGIEFREGL